MEPTFFATPAKFRAWLEKHHDTAPELVVGFYKKGSGKPSITWPEAVDEALCFGWIDGVRRSLDDERYTNRFTPRKPRSNWSARNIERAEELIDLGLMHPAGLGVRRAHGRAVGRLLVRAASFGHARRGPRAVPPEQEGVGVLHVQIAFVPDDRRLLGDEREEGGDAGAATRKADRRFRGRANGSAAHLPREETLTRRSSGP